MIFSRYAVEGVTTPVTICPIGDIQWNGDRDEIAYDQLREHITRCMQLPNPLFVGMGDYVDFASPSNRAAIAAARLYQGPRKALDDKALDLTTGVYDEILQPTRGRWLGMVSGHHLYPLITGGNTDIRLAELLEAPYLGTGIAVIRLEFREKHHRQVIQLWVAHGKGYGRKASRPVDMLEGLAADWEEIDVFLMGHHTKKAKADKNKLVPLWPKRGEPRLQHRAVHLVGTGGWSKGYVLGQPTYVEDMLLAPVVLGAPIIHVRPRWRSVRELDSDVWDANITVET